MVDFVSWNLSKAGRRMLRSDAFFVSFPKSGRTWVRVFFAAYVARLTGRPFALAPEPAPGVPRLWFTHDRWEHRMVSGWWGFIRGRRLIPPSARRSKKIVLMVRDPRDVVVSLYFHLMKRPNVFGWKQQPMSEMIRDPRFGIPRIVEIMNGWLREWGGRPDFLLMHYADCKADPAGRFRELLEFLGMNPVDETALEHAVEFSRFENMQALEATGSFAERELSAGDRRDKDSFKARRGKVGGFRDYFDSGDLAFAATQLERLDPRFGYTG